VEAKFQMHCLFVHNVTFANEQQHSLDRCIHVTHHLHVTYVQEIIDSLFDLVSSPYLTNEHMTAFWECYVLQPRTKEPVSIIYLVGFNNAVFFTLR
jgi:hypothetical protein